MDDGPVLYTTRGGEFEAKVKISGNYIARFDHAGMMLRIDKENYIKTGIEYVMPLKSSIPLMTRSTR